MQNLQVGKLEGTSGNLRGPSGTLEPDMCGDACASGGNQISTGTLAPEGVNQISVGTLAPEGATFAFQVVKPVVHNAMSVGDFKQL